MNVYGDDTVRFRTVSFEHRLWSYWRETLLEVHSPALSWHAYFRLPVCRDGATTSEMLPRDKEQTLPEVQVLPRRPRSENPHLWRGNEEVLGGCVPHLRTSRKVNPRKRITLALPIFPCIFWHIDLQRELLAARCSLSTRGRTTPRRLSRVLSSSPCSRKTRKLPLRHWLFACDIEAIPQDSHFFPAWHFQLFNEMLLMHCSRAVKLAHRSPTLSSFFMRGGYLPRSSRSTTDFVIQFAFN